MKRIDIHYDGQLYSVGGRELADLQAEIQRLMEAGSGWLVVNDGEGAPRQAHLLITPASALTLTPVPGDDEQA